MGHVRYLVKADPCVIGDSDDQVVRLVVQNGRGETVEEEKRFEGESGSGSSSGLRRSATCWMGALVFDPLDCTAAKTTTTWPRGTSGRGGSGKIRHFRFSSFGSFRRFGRGRV